MEPIGLFPMPKKKIILSGMVGSGFQLTIFSIGYGLIGCFMNDTNSVSIFWLSILGVYLISAGCNGFISGYVYKYMNGKRWIKSIVVSAMMFGVPFILSYFVINIVLKNIGYHLALNLPQLLMLFWTWGFLTIPLALYGGVLGRHSIESLRTDLISIQELKSRSYPPLSIICANCFLPYIGCESSLYYLFHSTISSLDTSRYLYGITTMLLISILLLTIFISSVSIHFYRKNANNIWWEIFVLSGSSGVCILFRGCISTFMMISNTSIGELFVILIGVCIFSWGWCLVTNNLDVRKLWISVLLYASEIYGYIGKIRLRSYL